MDISFSRNEIKVFDFTLETDLTLFFKTEES